MQVDLQLLQTFKEKYDDYSEATVCKEQLTQSMITAFCIAYNISLGEGDINGDRRQALLEGSKHPERLAKLRKVIENGNDEVSSAQYDETVARLELEETQLERQIDSALLSIIEPSLDAFKKWNDQGIEYWNDPEYQAAVEHLFDYSDLYDGAGDQEARRSDKECIDEVIEDLSITLTDLIHNCDEEWVAIEVEKETYHDEQAELLRRAQQPRDGEQQSDEEPSSPPSIDLKECQDALVNIMERKVQLFFEEAFATFQKHFGRWVKSNLIFLSLTGESQIAKVVADFLLNGHRSEEEVGDQDVGELSGQQSTRSTRNVTDTLLLDSDSDSDSDLDSPSSTFGDMQQIRRQGTFSLISCSLCIYH